MTQPYEARIQVSHANPPPRAADLVAQAMQALCDVAGFKIRVETQIRAQTFEFTFASGETVFFDIDAARRLICKTPRPVTLVYTAPLAEYLANGPIEMDLQALTADPERFDLSHAIYIATMYGEPIVIDGWHRLARAVQLGFDDVPAVFLNEEETESIIVKRVPAPA